MGLGGLAIAVCPMWPAAIGLIPPKVLEPIRCQLGVPHCVLDVLVPHPGLDRSGVVAGVCQGVTAPVSEHVGVDGKWHAGALA
jgi:hypothetical protein